jgi:hypothetical protein
MVVLYNSNGSCKIYFSIPFLAFATFQAHIVATKGNVSYVKKLLGRYPNN